MTSFPVYKDILLFSCKPGMTSNYLRWGAVNNSLWRSLKGWPRFSPSVLWMLLLYNAPFSIYRYFFRTGTEVVVISLIGGARYSLPSWIPTCPVETSYWSSLVTSTLYHAPFPRYNNVFLKNRNCRHCVTSTRERCAEFSMTEYVRVTTSCCECAAWCFNL